MGEPTIISDNGETIEFTLSNRKSNDVSMYVVKIDRDDYFSFVDNTTYWYVYTRKNNPTYIRANIGVTGNKKSVYLHNKILDRSPPMTDVVDHINGDSLDNRRCNFEIVSNALNLARGKTGGNSLIIRDRLGVRGFGVSVAYLPKLDRWQAYYIRDRKTKSIYIGSSRSEDILKNKIDKYILDNNIDYIEPVGWREL